MGIDLMLRGRLPKTLGLFAQAAGPWFSRVEAWMAGKAGDLHLAAERGTDETGSTLRCMFALPCAEIDFTSPRKGEVVASFRTSPQGPGYHAFVCDLLRSMETELGIQWSRREDECQDEGGYFLSGDWKRLKEHHDQWARSMASKIVNEMNVPGAPADRWKDVSICLPISPQFEGGTIRTHLGPKDVDFFIPIAADSSHAESFHLWPNRERDTLFHKNLAQAILWQAVAWCPPANERQKVFMRRALEHLERAHEAEPQGDFPWREWEELLALTGQASRFGDLIGRRASAVAQDTPRMGYRRQAIRYPINPDVEVRVSGELEPDEEGDGPTIALAAPGKRLELRLMRKSGTATHVPPFGKLLQAEWDAAAPGNRVEANEQGTICRGVWMPTNRTGSKTCECIFVLSHDEYTAILTARHDDEADRLWAMESWKCLIFSGRQQE